MCSVPNSVFGGLVGTEGHFSPITTPPESSASQTFTDNFQKSTKDPLLYHHHHLGSPFYILLLLCHRGRFPRWFGIFIRAYYSPFLLIIAPESVFLASTHKAHAISPRCNHSGGKSFLIIIFPPLTVRNHRLSLLCAPEWTTQPFGGLGCEDWYNSNTSWYVLAYNKTFLPSVPSFLLYNTIVSKRREAPLLF